LGAGITFMQSESIRYVRSREERGLNADIDFWAQFDPERPSCIYDVSQNSFAQKTCTSSTLSRQFVYWHAA
jgi:hypothetical protein